MAREAMDLCLQMLKESNKSWFDSYSVRNSVLIISHITFRDCRVPMFSDNLSRNSCILTDSTYLFLPSLNRFSRSLLDARSLLSWSLEQTISCEINHVS